MRVVTLNYGNATLALLITKGGKVMRVGKPQGMVERALRAWGLVVGIVYGALTLGVIVLIVLMDAINEPEDALVGTAIAVPLLVASGAFIWGQITWNTGRSWIVRTVTWFVLAVGVIPLISFSFILIPLLISALPSLWPRYVRTSENHLASQVGN